jgi:hypothetical protein
MENLRQAVEKDLADSLEGEWKMPVEITFPNGIMQKYSANNPMELLGGQILYYTRRENPATGEMMIVQEPVVTLRLSSLIQAFTPGEKCYIKMPISPRVNAEYRRFVFTPTRAAENGIDIGFIRIYPQRIENEAGPVPVS